MYKKEKSWKIEMIKMEENVSNEDILGIQLTLENEEKHIIIICYMNIEGNLENLQENVEKYINLNNLYNKYQNEKVMIMGDFNGHIGILNERISRNGELLINFASENNLEITNLTKAIGKITWERKGNIDQKSAIDYIMVNGKVNNEIKKVWIDEEKLFETNSDHNILITSIKRKKNRKQKTK